MDILTGVILFHIGSRDVLTYNPNEKSSSFHRAVGRNQNVKFPIYLKPVLFRVVFKFVGLFVRGKKGKLDFIVGSNSGLVRIVF